MNINKVLEFYRASGGDLCKYCKLYGSAVCEPSQCMRRHVERGEDVSELVNTDALREWFLSKLQILEGYVLEEPSPYELLLMKAQALNIMGIYGEDLFENIKFVGVDPQLHVYRGIERLAESVQQKVNRTKIESPVSPRLKYKYFFHYGDVQVFQYDGEVPE